MFSKSENYFKQFPIREFAFRPFLASIFSYKERHNPYLGLSITHETGYLQIFCSSSRTKNRSYFKLYYFFYKCFGKFGVCQLKTTKMAVRLIKIQVMTNISQKLFHKSFKLQFFLVSPRHIEKAQLVFLKMVITMIIKTIVTTIVIIMAVLLSSCSGFQPSAFYRTDTL